MLLTRKLVITNRLAGYNSDDTNRRRLNKMFVKQKMKGEELKDMMYRKWLKVYDIKLIERDNHYFLDIQSHAPTNFPEYCKKLDDIANQFNKWQIAGSIREKMMALELEPSIEIDNDGNKIGMNVSIALDVTTARSAEFDL